MTDEMTVSKKAWRKGGSRSFVEVGSKVSVYDLLHGIIIQSGNDAAIVLAEGISGTEEAFADEMNFWAKKMGMVNTNFRNATGWPPGSIAKIRIYHAHFLCPKIHFVCKCFFSSRNTLC